MSEAYTAIFRKSHLLLEKLCSAAVNFSEESKRLSEYMDYQVGEADRIHEAFLHSLQSAVTQYGRAESQIMTETQIHRETMMTLEQICLRRVQQLVTELAKLAHNIETGGDELWYSLHELEQKINALSTFESDSDTARNKWLYELIRQCCQINEFSSQIAYSISETQQALATSIELQQTMDMMQHTHNALDLQQRAAVARARGWYETAVALLEEAVHQAPDRIELRLSLADNYLATHRVVGATKQLAVAAEFVPGSHRVLYIKGRLALERGEGERAVELLSQCVRLAPDELDYHMSLAEAYCVVNRVQDAIAQWSYVLEHEPEHPVARRRLLEVSGS